MIILSSSSAPRTARHSDRCYASKQLYAPVYVKNSLIMRLLTDILLHDRSDCHDF